MLNFENVKEHNGAQLHRFCRSYPILFFTHNTHKVYSFRETSDLHPELRWSAPSFSSPVLYIPPKVLKDFPPILHDPVTCKLLFRVVLNLYWYIEVFYSYAQFRHLIIFSSQTDIHCRLQVCPLCLLQNAFLLHYKDISNTNLPAKLLPKYTTALKVHDYRVHLFAPSTGFANSLFCHWHLFRLRRHV